MAVFLLILVPSKQNFVFEQESHRTQATRAEAHTIGGGDLIDFFAPGRVMLNLLWVGAGRCLCAGLIIHRVQKLENRPCLPSDDVFPV
jgi:hypothetical protein